MRDILRNVLLSVLAVMSLTLCGCGSSSKGGGNSPSPSPSPSPPPGPAPKDCGNRCVVPVKSWPAIKAPLSFAIKTHNMVYISGCPGFNFSTMKLVPGGIEAETTQALHNVEVIVAAAGTSMDRIVSCQVAMANITRDFGKMNKAYAAFFTKDPPSRTAVQVAKLEQGALVEIQCMAAAKTADHSVIPFGPLPKNMTIPLSSASMSSNIIYASGVQGRDKSMKIVQGGIANETTQALASLKDVLAKAGSDPGHVVACTVYISDMKKFSEMNDAYKKFWPKDGALKGGFPSRICVQASEIAGGANVEITCTAISNKKGIAAPKVITVPGWKPMPAAFPLSIATSAEGMVFASGMQGMNTTTMKLVEGGITAETTQTLKNIEEVFTAAGADLASGAVECEVSLGDLADYDAMNKAYSAFWDENSAPARIAVQVAGIAGGAKVEIKCTGVLSTTVTQSVVKSQDEIII